MTEGQIIEGRGGLYTVRDRDGRDFVLRAKKKFRHQHMTPMVGDYVLFTPGEGEEHGWLEEIQPRKSECLRPPVANIDLLVIVLAPAPEADWQLIDKLLLGAKMQGMETLLAVNKCDLDDGVYQRAAEDYRGAETEVLRVSAEKAEGLEELEAHMQGKTCCFAGQSGVGKSTLLNALLGSHLQTGEISRIERGKHTTRYAHLLEENGLRVMDTPGFSLLEFEQVMDPIELKNYYPEFLPYEGQCRFQPCYHGSEPGCAVTQAVKDGKISRNRAERYHEMLEKTRQLWRERYD